MALDDFGGFYSHLYMKALTQTVYMVIFKGHKFSGFRCKLLESKILILEKKQWLKETMYST